MPVDIQFQIRQMIKDAILQYLLRKYITDLTECQGGIPSIEPNEMGRPQVRIIAIRKGVIHG